MTPGKILLHSAIAQSCIWYMRSRTHEIFFSFSLYPHLFSRAYLNFKNQDDIVLFRDRFDGYVFIDNRGEAIRDLKLKISIQSFSQFSHCNQSDCNQMQYVGAGEAGQK